MLQRLLYRTYDTAKQTEAADVWVRDVGGDSMLKDWQDCMGKWIAGGWCVGREKNKLVATRASCAEEDEGTLVSMFLLDFEGRTFSG